MHTVAGDGVAGIKRRRRDLYSDGVRNLATVSVRGRLKEDLESSTWRRGKSPVITPVSRREDRFHRGGYGVDRRRNEGRNTFNSRDGLAPYRPQAPYQAPRAEHQGYHHPRVNLNSLTKQPKEILASEL
ncbi:hypothetical protein Tco_0828488 [Tanacetum coccineum]